MRRAMRGAAGLALLAAASCSPIIRVESRVAGLPPGARLESLHVRARASCEDFDVTAPRPVAVTPPLPGAEEVPLFGDRIAGVAYDASDAEEDAGIGRAPYRSAPHVVVPERSGLDLALQLRSSSCNIAMTAWYDANGNGVVDGNDLVGTLPSTTVVDRGPCRGNLNVVRPIQMRPR